MGKKSTAIQYTWGVAAGENDRRRAELRGAPALRREPSVDTVTAALDTARQVEADRRQRAVPVDVSDPDDLDELRLELRDLLSAPAPDMKVALWRAATSGGRALTTLGADNGYELRLSYYR